MNYRIFSLMLFTLFSIQQAIASGLQLQGVFKQGGLVTGFVTPKSKITQDGLKIKVSPEGIFLLGFNRDAKPTSTLKIYFPNGNMETRILKVAKRQYKIQRIDGLPPSKVNPKSKKTLKRIRKETRMIRQARLRNDNRLDFLPGFDWPVIGKITGVYGSQRILNGQKKRPHYGVDVAAPVGTPVHAVADGIITVAHPDMYYSGGTILLDHGHGLSSAFLHMSQILVKVNQRVKRGDVIGLVGSKGRSTGPHIDWRMNLFKKRLDPQLFAHPMPKK